MTYIKFHRMNLGLTQHEVAKKARCSQGMYCEIERGQKVPGPKLHKRLAQALGRPVEEFTAKLHGVDLSQMQVGRYPGAHA